MTTELSDRALAATIVTRLNALLGDPDIREDIQSLIETRIPCSEATKSHKTIQVGTAQEGNGLGFLGLLNGIVGRRGTQPYEGWGHIGAAYGDDGRLETFVLVG